MCVCVCVLDCSVSICDGEKRGLMKRNVYVCLSIYEVPNVIFITNLCG